MKVMVLAVRSDASQLAGAVDADFGQGVPNFLRQLYAAAILHHWCTNNQCLCLSGTQMERRALSSSLP